MRYFKIFYKLFFTHAALVLFAVVILSLIFYSILRSSLIQRTADQLSSINILKKELIESHLSRSMSNLQNLQQENRLVSLFAMLSAESINVQDQQLLDDLIQGYGFDNVHVLKENDDLLFSKFPENGRRSFDSLLHLLGTHTRELKLVDASLYSPDQKTWLFYYLPVASADSLLGYLLIEESFDRIQEILLERTGMGATGESYLIGDDLLMRSASRFFPERPPLSMWVETGAARDVFTESPKEMMVIDDYRGERVLSVYRRINFEGINWAILTEIDFNEAMQPIIRLGNYLFGSTLLLVLFTVVLTIFISNSIARPMLRLRDQIGTLSQGIIPAPIKTPTSTDEISQIIVALNQLIDGLRRTTTFAAEIGSGNFESEYQTLSPDDSLGKALLRMRDELRALHDRELTLLRGRAAALLEGQEYERKRITQDLHDGVGQMLTAIRMRVDQLDGEHQLKGEIKSLINETIEEVRRISYHVMPHSLVDYGLEPALKGLCDNVKKYSGVRIDYRYVREVEHNLNFDVTIAVFRIVQEGLNNILKHANASQVDLHVLDKEDEIYVILSDNGVGLPDKGERESEGSGLRNMRERARLLNGNFEIHSSPGQGTVIEVMIPFDKIPDNG